MKTKSKVILSSILAAIFVVASVCLGVQLFTQKSDLTKGVYDGAFTAFADGETTATEIGTMKGMVSTKGDYLLLATALKIENFGDYSAIGYEITEDGTAVTAEGLESDTYYTGISVKTGEDTSKEWTMEEVFEGEEGVTGLIVAEISYDETADYAITPYVVSKTEGKLYGEAQEVLAEKIAYKFEAEDATFETQEGGSQYANPVKILNTSAASGSKILGNTQWNYWTIALSIESDVDCEAKLFVCLCGHASNSYKYITDGRYFTVSNSAGETVYDKSTVGELTINGGEQYVEKEVTTIDLKAGKNVITYHCTSNTSFCGIDYFKLAADASLDWWTGEEDDEAYEYEYKIEAESTTFATIESNQTNAVRTYSTSAASGGKILGATNQNKWTITFTVTSDVDCKAQLIICLCGHASQSYKYITDGLYFTVNNSGGETVYDKSTIGELTINGGEQYVEKVVTTIDLKAGENVITYKCENFMNICGFDYFKLLSTASLA